MFRKLYNKVLVWADHPYSERILMVVAFFESACFPIPPDVMLAPMTMTKPERAWRLAFITTVFSVLGGVFGYLIGYFAFQTVVFPLLEFFNKQEAYAHALVWFDRWGVWVIILAAFTPIPYKLFTISAGALQMNLLLFIFASIIRRGIRFYLVCGIFKLGNKYLADWIERWITVIGCCVLLFLATFYYFLLH